MSHVHWRWTDKDFGFRFRSGGGKARAEYYQAREPGAFYVVPAKQRKLDKDRMEELAAQFPAATSPRVVPSPWRNYDRDWDWISTDEGILLNFAGCLDKEEIERREDEGVQRAMELVMRLVEKAEPAAVSVQIIQQIHVELMGEIYPFAGTWRIVELHKGEGATKWPLPPSGIQPVIDVFARDVLSKTPFISANDAEVFSFASLVMNELLAIHPFREGNGRTAFILGNMILMQNDLLPLNVYDRRRDQPRYFAACEAGRIHADYRPLASLIEEWQDRARAQWEAEHA